GMKAFVVNRVGDWGFICGLSLLLWGMGGAWLDQGRYLSDYRARFIAVQAEALAHGEHGEHEAAGAEDKKAAAHEAEDEHEKPAGKRDVREIAQRGKGQLTFTAYPGARVYLGVADRSQLAGHDVFGISPFIRKDIDAGLQNITVVPGGGATVGDDGFENAQ